MRRRVSVAIAVMAAMIGGGAGAALAGHGPAGEFGGPPPGAERGPGHFFERMAKILKLSDAQKGKIQTFLDAEQEQGKALRDKLHENRKKLMQAAEAATFDEAATRKIAMAQGQLEAELTLSRIRTQSRINAVLTDDQRELLKELRPPGPEHRPAPEQWNPQPPGNPAAE